MPFTEFIQTYPHLKSLPIEEQMFEYENYIDCVLQSMED